MLGILITWLVTTISFLIIARLPLGVEIDSFGKAAVSAAVFGVLNALLRPILGFFYLSFNSFNFGSISVCFECNYFGLAAALVTGFRLRWGIWSALLGSIALSLINSVLFNLLATLRL